MSIREYNHPPHPLPLPLETSDYSDIFIYLQEHKHTNVIELREPYIRNYKINVGGVERKNLSVTVAEIYGADKLVETPSRTDEIHEEEDLVSVEP